MKKNPTALWPNLILFAVFAIGYLLGHFFSPLENLSLLRNILLVLLPAYLTSFVAISSKKAHKIARKNLASRLLIYLLYILAAVIIYLITFGPKSPFLLAHNFTQFTASKLIVLFLAFILSLRLRRPILTLALCILMYCLMYQVAS